MSLAYLKAAVEANDTEKLIRYVCLHFGDGNEEAGRKEIDKAWIEALKLLLEVPATNREFIENTVKETDAETRIHRKHR
jgi:tRNA G37 N-methylase Trm5